MKMNKTLEKILKISAPIAAGALGLAVIEGLGVSGYLQQYEMAKTDVTRQFFGETMANINYYSSYAVRAILDTYMTLLPAIGSYYYLDNKLYSIVYRIR